MKLVMLAIVASAGIARADAYECKSTETQAECHDRLKCKADEEVADCQARLRSGGGGGNGGNAGNSGGPQTNPDRRDDRGSDRGSDRRDRQPDRGSRDGDQRDAPPPRRTRRRSSSSGGGGGGGGGGSSSFVANKTFGLGLELGEPDGLNGKYFVSPSTAIDFGLGYIYDHYYYGDGIHLYGDYLFHFLLTSQPAFDLPLYIGPGVRFWQFHYCVGNVCDYGGSAVGIRMPVGITFDLNNVPLDIFVQLVPTLDFLGGDYYRRHDDRVHFGIDGSVGIRFWFN